MKRLLMLATLAASVTGCVADQGDAPVRFLEVRTLSGTASECTLGETPEPLRLPAKPARSVPANPHRQAHPRKRHNP